MLHDLGAHGAEQKCGEPSAVAGADKRRCASWDSLSKTEAGSLTSTSARARIMAFGVAGALRCHSRMLRSHQGVTGQAPPFPAGFFVLLLEVLAKLLTVRALRAEFSPFDQQLDVLEKSWLRW